MMFTLRFLPSIHSVPYDTTIEVSASENLELSLMFTDTNPDVVVHDSTYTGGVYIERLRFNSAKLILNVLGIKVSSRNLLNNAILGYTFISAYNF